MKLWELFKKSLCEDNGNPSSSRINTQEALFVFLCGYIGIAINVCFMHTEMIPMVFEATVGLIVAILGLRIVAKTKEQKMIGAGVNASLAAPQPYPAPEEQPAQ